VLFNDTQTNVHPPLSVTNTGGVTTSGVLAAQTITYRLYVTSGGAQPIVSAVCTLYVNDPPTIACPVPAFLDAGIGGV
jgi:hypothetical protein